MSAKLLVSVDISLYKYISLSVLVEKTSIYFVTDYPQWSLTNGKDIRDDNYCY